MKIIEHNLPKVFKEYSLIGSSQKNAYKGDLSTCPTLTEAMGKGGGQVPMIIVDIKGNPKRNNIKGQYASTFTAGAHSGGNHSDMDLIVTTGYRVRRLTPKEAFRLQGFPDTYYEKATKVNSDTRLYQQAGNGVTVDVIYGIARRFDDE